MPETTVVEERVDPPAPQPIQTRSEHVILSQAPIIIDEINEVASADNEPRNVMEVTIIKPGLSKAMIGDHPVNYTEEALKNSLPLWESASCFCDHFNKSVRNIAGVYFAPWYDGGIKARLRFLDSSLYRMVRQIVEDKAKGLPVPEIGISADFIVNAARSKDTVEVTGIIQVISADIVFLPAAGGSFDRVLNSVMALQQSIPALTARTFPAEAGIQTELPPTPPIPLTLSRVEGSLSKDPPAAEPAAVPLSCHSCEGRNPEGEGQGNAEKRIRDLQSTADKLRAQVQNQTADISMLNSSIGHLTLELQEAVTRYRAGILQSNPEIPADMVTGRCVAEIDASLSKAQAVVDAVKANLQDQIPAGAPARSGPDVSTLTPRQKIEYGISQGQRGRK